MHLEVIAPLSWLSLPCDESQRQRKKRRRKKATVVVECSKRSFGSDHKPRSPCMYTKAKRPHKHVNDAVL